MSTFAPLIDSFGRTHNNLRISVTDRCNIRCFYCMPDENVRFKPRDEILTFEEIVRVVRALAKCGINKLRITGGEPLVRADLPDLISRLSAIPGIEDIAMTTNGILLAKSVAELKRAGLNRLNVSLDAMNEETFRRIARRDGLPQVMEGIRTAIDAGYKKIRLNAVAISGITEPEIIPLAKFARETGLELRFIEFMPLDAEGNWTDQSVLSGASIRNTLKAEFGELSPATRNDASQPAMDYAYADGNGVVGFIDPVSQPFCGTCNRLRITAEGQVKNCLFSDEGWDVREILRSVETKATGSEATDKTIVDLVRDSILAKKAGHGMDDESFVRPQRAMYEIGG